MYPVIMQAISAERSTQMRKQAAAWRRARDARGALHAPPAGISLAPIARLARNARSLAWRKTLQGPAAA